MTQPDLALGPLEIAVMERLWRNGQADARGLHAQFERTRGVSLSTIQSTLERLYRKGVLARTKVSHAYIYEPAMSEDAVMARMVDTALRPFRSGKARGLLAAFNELADTVDDATLDELERLIADRKAASGRSRS